MKKYWLYLDSYTFLFSNKEKFMIYNSLDGSHFIGKNKGEISKLIDQLQNPEQMYCISLSENSIKKKQIREFIHNIQKTFTGDIMESNTREEKPLIIYPKPRVMRGIENLKPENEYTPGERILDYLHHLTLQITDSCSLACARCPVGYKQFTTCTKKDNDVLDISIIHSLFKNSDPANLTTVQLVGGNPFSYHDMVGLISIISTTKYKYNWYCTPQHLFETSPEIVDEIMHLSNCQITIQCYGQLEANEWERIIPYLYHYSCVPEFIMSTEDDLTFIEETLSAYSIKNFTIKPLILNTNKKFIEDALFLDEDTILSKAQSKKGIFRHQLLNTLDFGAITIMANGDVYANRNMPSIGNIQHMSITELLNEELAKGSSWLRIRNKKPCTDCLYQWLCPSPSNYEIAMGKNNLCTVK